jgi:hypothetical protein
MSTIISIEHSNVDVLIATNRCPHSILAVGGSLPFDPHRGELIKFIGVWNVLSWGGGDFESTPPTVCETVINHPRDACESVIVGYITECGV